MSEWISIKDRLPSDGEIVLVTLHYEEIYRVVCQYVRNLCTLKKVYNHLFIVEIPPRVKLKIEDYRQFYLEKNKVTYWMPLSKPPEEI